jgi:transposase-like protein
MERRKFTREFKLEASADLGVHQSQLRGWVKSFGADPQHVFPARVR